VILKGFQSLLKDLQGILKGF